MNYDTLALPVLEARVDWITCTAFEKERFGDLLAIGQQNTEAEKSLGGKMDDWHFQSYRGFQCGRWRYGYGKLGAIVVVSGEQADIAAEHLAVHAEHWSRVDYCVTVLDRDDVLKPDEHYWEAWPSCEVEKHKRPRLTRHQVYEGGATITFGDRASAFFTRVYNKHEESPQEYPKGAWRYETEMKRHASEQQQAIILRSGVSAAHCLNVVSTEISRLHLSVPWRKSASVVRPSQIHYRPDADRTLGWLASQVKPPVQFAAAARGRKAVLLALEL